MGKRIGLHKSHCQGFHSSKAVFHILFLFLTECYLM